GCDDANACTRTDACAGGVCVGHDPVACAPADACHEAGTCAPGTGTCTSAVRLDGTACDDGDPCTASDACTAGVCAGQLVADCGGVSATLGDATVDDTFCLDVRLTNRLLGVRTLVGTVVDADADFGLASIACAGRAAGVACSASPNPPTGIRVTVTAPGGCIAPGDGAIATLCLHDPAPLCRGRTVQLGFEDVAVTDCTDHSVATMTGAGGGHVLCGGLAGDCDQDGAFGLPDVLHTIDVAIGKTTATDAQRPLCDTTCDGEVDVFDVLRAVDALRGHTVPAACAPDAGEPVVTATIAPAHRARVMRLANPGRTIRGVEMTLAPVAGPAAVRAARPTRRTRGFTVAYYQADATAPVKLMLVSLDGKAIKPGTGRIVRLRLAGSGARLAVTGAKIAE